MHKPTKKLLVLASPCLLLITACSGGGESPYAEHDTKYRNAGACVLDTATGLTWETKSEQAGLHDWRNTYSWHNPQEAHGELEFRGLADGGECVGSKCDTYDFVRAVNATSLCGYADWRMPSRDELYSISDLRKAAAPPTANMRFFPYTQANEYWSGNDYSFQNDAAWAWSFLFGHDRVDWKYSPKHVRLVRGEAGELPQVKE